MAELLKNNYNKKYIERVAREIYKNCPSFNSKAFIKLVMGDDWESLELKSRMKKISKSLKAHLPDDYKECVEVILKSSSTFGGFEGMFFPDFIETYGAEKRNWKTSLRALEELTKFSSSEFAIRPFIISDSTKVMKVMLNWSKSKNYHVRRLASEGCRPRLPWAIAIEEFKEDPSLILPILENLKNDPELYVRRSVANNLNDISKDHPELVLNIANEWIGKNSETDWIIKHALRTLLKKGNPKALSLFGFTPARSLKIKNLSLKKKRVKIGDFLIFEFLIDCKKDSLLRVEYAIDYMKKSGAHSRKVFSLSEKKFEKGAHLITRRQSFKEMSTRKHYKGVHFLSIIINGIEICTVEFSVV